MIAHKQNGELEVEFVPAFSGGGIKDDDRSGRRVSGRLHIWISAGIPHAEGRRAGQCLRLFGGAGYRCAQLKERNEVEAFLREHGWDQPVREEHRM